jgi:photosystem II stability/assembly factor-like uncharacterized protein
LSQFGWTEQSHVYTTQGALVDAFFINENTGWFCGQFGKLSKTTNGGTNWFNISVSNTYSYRTVYFLNDQTGWTGLGTYISGIYRGIILKTTNGGLSFSGDTLINEYNVPEDITFMNAQTGWFAASGIYRTTNSGNTWTRYLVNGFENMGFGAVSFPSSTVGFCSGSFFNQYMNIIIQIIAKSTNGGINWHAIKIDTTQGGTNLGYREMQFLNVNTGYQNASHPLKTTNGGSTWFSILEYGPYSSMYFRDVNKGWFGKWDYSVYTSDGGETWTSQPLPISALFHGIYFVNDVTGWGVGINIGVTFPRVFKTTSGGFIGINQISTEIPKEYSLSQNYPNPFNPMTKLKFQMPNSGLAILKVYDLLGKEVQELVNQQLSPGTYEVDFDGSNLTSGVYYYRLDVSALFGGSFTETRKMVLIK